MIRNVSNEVLADQGDFGAFASCFFAQLLTQANLIGVSMLTVIYDAEQMVAE